MSREVCCECILHIPMSREVCCESILDYTWMIPLLSLQITKSIQTCRLNLVVNTGKLTLYLNYYYFLIVSLSCCLLVSLYHCLVLLSSCLIVPLSCCYVVFLSHYIIVLLFCCLNVHCIIVLLFCCLNVHCTLSCCFAVLLFIVSLLLCLVASMFLSLFRFHCHCRLFHCYCHFLIVLLFYCYCHVLLSLLLLYIIVKMSGRKVEEFWILFPPL